MISASDLRKGATFEFDGQVLNQVKELHLLEQN